MGLSYFGVRRARGRSNSGSPELIAWHTDRLDQLRNHIIHDAMDGTPDFGRPLHISPSPQAGTPSHHCQVHSCASANCRSVSAICCNGGSWWRVVNGYAQLAGIAAADRRHRADRWIVGNVGLPHTLARAPICDTCEAVRVGSVEGKNPTTLSVQYTQYGSSARTPKSSPCRMFVNGSGRIISSDVGGARAYTPLQGARYRKALFGYRATPLRRTPEHRVEGS